MRSPGAYTFKDSAGFSLIELIMVIGVLGFLMVVSVPLGVNFYRTRQLDVYEGSMVQALRRAQLKSMSVENDSSFGVYVKPGQYTLFKGTSYITRDTVYDEVFDLPASLQVSGLSEIVFDKLNGTSVNTGTITLTVDSKTEDISINEMGRINY